MSHQDRLNIAVFIDFDNIEIGVKQTLGQQFDVAIVLDAIKERGEVVTKIRLSLVVPGMRDRVTCELPADEAPKVDVLERWELRRVGWWLVPTACAPSPSSAATPALGKSL